MTVPSRALIEALRTTADRIHGGARYQWTHMGACNCGHLAQTVTELSAAEIHAMALRKQGDWRDQVLEDEATPEYCPTSGLPMDALIERLLDLGLTRRDLAHLERLSDPAVLRELPVGGRTLDYRRRTHVVAYMHAFATKLERQLTGAVDAVRASGQVRAARGRSVPPRAAPRSRSGNRL